MDKNILEQYLEIKGEIRDLHERIDRDQRRLERIKKEGLVSDTVRGTRKDGTIGPMQLLSSEITVRENGRQTLLPWQDRLETMSHRQQEKIITILSLARMEYLRKLKMMATEFLELLHL